MTETTYWDEENTKRQSETHRNEKGECHRLDGPAYRDWDPNGRNWITIWNIFGVEVKL